MQIEELNNYTKLFDTYGLLLSKKQYELMDKFLNLDLSESELAEFENSSRQSVHDAITKAKKQLLEFEKKCKIVKKQENINSKLEQVKALLSKQKIDAEQIKMLIDEIKTN
ncbi:MAG: DNA-binding protein [Clostridia bacterium]|nr:DNA-binding protein [Clostridia bacterium]